MKTTTAALLLLAFNLLAFAEAPMAPIDPAAYKEPIRVACVGDSITQGAGAERGKSYPSQLQALLGDKWKVGNFGVSGRTLLRKGDHPYWNEKAFQDAQAFKPNVVVIMLGTNDTKPQNWAHKDEFFTDYKDLVKTFQALESKPRVYVCRPCPVPGTGNFGINEANLQIEIPLIDKLAAEEKLGVIDMHAPLESKPELLPDRVHPNTAGAGVMAETTYEAFTGKPTPQPAGAR
jgi:lysophospholipase L1-like esterase